MECGPISLRAEKARRLFSLLVAKRYGIDPETAVKGGRDEDPVKPFLFHSVQAIDSLNPGHEVHSSAVT